LIRRTSASNETYTIKPEEAVTQTTDGYIRVGTDAGRERVPTRIAAISMERASHRASSDGRMCVKRWRPPHPNVSVHTIVQ
jgi:hypothetical protein